jgi:hypothetical protein
MEQQTLNPCGELGMTKPMPVVPWVQIQWMNHFRVKAGKPPFTKEEIAALHAELDPQYEEACRQQ